MTSSASLSQLPLELLILVFQSLSDFSAVSALSRTSRQIYNVWQTNTDPICETLLARTTVCLEQARGLVNVQPRVSFSESPLGDSLTTLEHTKQVVVNARMAHKVLEEHQKVVIQATRGKSGMTQKGRTAFIQAFYRAFTARILIHCRPYICLIDFCAGWHILDFKQVIEVVDWLVFGCEIGSTPDLGRAVGESHDGNEWCDIWWHVHHVNKISFSPHTLLSEEMGRPFGYHLLPDLCQNPVSERGSRLESAWTEAARAELTWQH